MAYCTEAQVRENNGFEKRHRRTDLKSVQTFTLPWEAFAVSSVLKAGVALTQVSGSPAAGEFQFIEPKTINFGDIINGEDIVIVGDVELTSSQVNRAISRATEKIRSKMVRRYGETEVNSWDTTTPPVIEEIAIELAGYFAERIMLRVSRSYDAEALAQNRLDIKGLMKELTSLDVGATDVVGVPSTGATTLVVGRDGSDLKDGFNLFEDNPSIDDLADHELSVDDQLEEL